MRILGIDYGERRIGLAKSDPMGWTAQGLPTLERSDIESDLDQLGRVITENEIARIVIGLPKNMDNTLGAKANEVLQFVEVLQERFGLPVHIVDERLSTVRAHRVMSDGGLSLGKRKERVDMVSAQFILQSFLDSSASAKEGELESKDAAPPMREGAVKPVRRRRARRRRG